MTLKDVYLSFAGRMPVGDRVHRSIEALSPGDRLQAQQHQGKWELRDGNEVQVGMLASSFEAPSDMRCIEARVSAVAKWNSEHSDAQYRQELKCDEWEVVVPGTRVRVQQGSADRALMAPPWVPPHSGIQGSVPRPSPSAMRLS